MPAGGAMGGAGAAFARAARAIVEYSDLEARHAIRFASPVCVELFLWIGFDTFRPTEQLHNVLRTNALMVRLTQIYSFHVP